MRLAATGFVSDQTGSVAAANALLLRALLESGWEVTFFSKASFVDPRPVAGDHEGFHFVDTDNRITDRARARVERVPVLGRAAGMTDAAAYNRLLVRKISAAHASHPFDLCLWLGDYARGRAPGLPTVSLVQGAPGSDARSIGRHFDQIAKFAGRTSAWKWRILAALRLSRAGLPPFQHSDHFIVGSSVSRGILNQTFGVPLERISASPYPINLELFRSRNGSAPRWSGLRCLWLGRIVPRKRLDVLLDAAEAAVREGVDLRVTVVGDVGFVRGYGKALAGFAFPDRLRWERKVGRTEVPALMHEHDILVQPSEEEDFGSSVAEAQACGLPVIVGATSGNADYLCSRDVHLADYRPQSLARVFREFAERKNGGRLGDPAESRTTAERWYSESAAGERFRNILKARARRQQP